MKRNTLNFGARLKVAGLATEHRAEIETMSLEGAAKFLTEKLANGVHLTAINAANILKTLGIETRTQAAKRLAREPEPETTIQSLAYCLDFFQQDCDKLAGAMLKGLDAVANLYNRLGEKSPDPLIEAVRGIERFREKYDNGE